MTIIDYIFLAGLAFFFCSGCVKGFITQVFKILTLVVCLFGTILTHTTIAQIILDNGWLTVNMTEEEIVAGAQSIQNNANVLGVIISLVVFFLLCMLLKKIFASIFDNGGLKLVNRVLGGVLNAFIWFSIVGAAYVLVETAVDFANGVITEANALLQSISTLLKTDVEETQTITNFMSTELLDKIFEAFNPLGDFIRGVLVPVAG